MADTVQYLMEAQIPELEDFEKRGYFSRAEVKAIVKRRQDFEYLLKRRAALKLDYLRYIEYETKLEDLRRMRRKSLGITGKKSKADVAIVRRIHFIYERVTRKFKSDVKLWMQWIKYCKHTNSAKLVSKVATKALQRHSTVAALWIEASVWEFEHNLNVGAARTLMQQGLRMCKEDVAMWSEYFRLELLYVQQLRQRRNVLGLDVPAAPPDIAEGEPSLAPLDPEEAVQKVLSGAVAHMVFKSAVSAVPNQLELRRSMLKVLSTFSFPGIKALERKMYASLEADFPESEEAWDMQACWIRSRLNPKPSPSSKEGDDDEQPSASGSADSMRYNPSCHAKVSQVYRRALAKLPTHQMYEMYVLYLKSVVETLLKAGNGGGGGEDASMGETDMLEAAAAVGAELLSLMHEAHEAGMAHEQLYITWVHWSFKLGIPKAALKASRLGCERHPSSPKVWSCRIRTELAVMSPKSQSPVSLIMSALKAVAPGDDSAVIWMQALDVMQPGTANFSQLVDQLVAALSGSAKGPLRGGMGSVAATFLEKITSCQDIAAARVFVKRLLALPPAGADFFRAAIAMEQQLLQGSRSGTAGAGVKAADKAVCRMFEAAVDAYGSKDAELWLEFAAHERESLRGAGNVYWRATKALSDPDEFVARYQNEVKG